jgi:hypothetical protein
MARLHTVFTLQQVVSKHGLLVDGCAADVPDLVEGENFEEVSK